MDFYFDENYSQHIASALNELERSDAEHKVFSTQVVWKRGIMDIELIPLIAEVGGIFITKDTNIAKRKAEVELLKKLKVNTVFIRSKNQSHWEQIETLIRSWRKLTKECGRRNGREHFMILLKTNGTIEEMP